LGIEAHGFTIFTDGFIGPPEAHPDGAQREVRLWIVRQKPLDLLKMGQCSGKISLCNKRICQIFSER
jgi:hypothetical protein